jgi:hypothetical protein
MCPSRVPLEEPKQEAQEEQKAENAEGYRQNGVA